MILILGDIHGNYKHIKWIIKSRHLTDTTIIQVGDFGVGSMPNHDVRLLENLNDFLKEINCFVYAVRGNHDDPKYFNGDYIMSNLKLMPDYSTAKIEEKNFLFVGGAYSIDRKHSLGRMQLAATFGLDEPEYWFDEHFNLDMNKLEEIKDIDVVITHTAPDWCYPDNKGGFGNFVEAFMFDDEFLREDLTRERDHLSQMFYKLKENGNQIKLHFYGHFHNSAITENEGIKHILVDQGETKDIGRYFSGEYIF
jgi:predicted phosphodiesterase